MSKELEGCVFGTATISDALDLIGIPGQCRQIRPLEVSFRLAGPAFTVRMVPTGITGRTVGDYVDDVPAGHIVVIDSGGSEDATVWGDILTLAAHRRGLAGTVIDGVCRDVSQALAVGYPLFSRGVYMRTGKGRMTAEALNVPVAVGGCRVDPGDQVIGDADGVVIVPQVRFEEVLAVAAEIQDAEQNIRSAVMKGLRLDEARNKYTYHTLQKPR